MIDFSNVSNIVIPEGEVEKITCNNITLWEKKKVEEYTKVEYIQLDGTQYVDTNIICNENTKIEMTFTREEESARYLFGVASSDNTASVTGYQSGVANGSWRFGGGYTRPSVDVNKKHTFIMDKNGITIDSSKKSYSGTVGVFNTPQTLIIGGCNSVSGTVGSVRHIGKIYEFKMYENDKLILHYMPCINKEGIYGFYDYVNKQFILLQQ